TALVRSLLDSIADGVMVADAEGEGVMCNPAAERLLLSGGEHGARMYQADGVTPLLPEETPLRQALRHGAGRHDVVVRPADGGAAGGGRQPSSGAEAGAARITAGLGLAGRAWDEGRSVWEPAGFAFPILATDGVAGIVEMRGGPPWPPGDDLLGLAEDVGR